MELRILIGCLIITLARSSPPENIAFELLDNVNTMDFNSLKETFAEFEDSVRNFTEHVETELREVQRNSHNITSEIEKDEAYLLWLNMPDNSDCKRRVDFDITKMTDAVTIEMLSMRIPVMEGLSEIEGTLGEVRQGITMNLGTAEAKLAACQLSEANCTADVANQVRTFISKYVCRFNGYCNIADRNTSVALRKRRSVIDTCGLEKFTCRNGNCISPNYVCDNDNDCRDWSDEKYGGCSKGCLPPSHIRCRNLNCINPSQICNRRDDCGDNSDELGCNLPCPNNQFKCKNEKCIYATSVCNGVNDCGDGSDETSECSKECIGKRCKNLKCVKPEEICNRKNDCGDNSDEEGCIYRDYTEENCSLNQGRLVCSNGTECVDLRTVCDGKADCTDGRDEGENCRATNCTLSKCVSAGGVCFSHPSGQLCLRHCPYGFTATQEGICTLALHQPVFSPNSLLESIESVDAAFNRLLAGYRLLKLQTRYKISNLAMELIHCRNNQYYSKKINV